MLRCVRVERRPHDDGGVKRSTAISRLTDVADGLDRAKLWPGATVVAGYLFGAMLEPFGDVDRVQLALVVDEPAQAVPWMARPAHLEALAAMLRFDKLPLSWSWRPLAWPVWNHEIVCAACFWTAAGGRDQAVFDALASGRVDQLRLDEPVDRKALHDELTIERDVGRLHLADVVERFYDQQWRREHTAMAFIQTTTCGGPLPDISTSTALSETLDAESASTSRSISGNRSGLRAVSRSVILGLW